MGRLKKMIHILITCMIPLTAAGCGGGFDASGYTEAILDLQFQGDIKNARTLVAGATQEELREMYQEFIENFVAGYITDGMEISDAASEEFKELAAAIFASMRYEVGDAKKTGKKELLEYGYISYGKSYGGPYKINQYPFRDQINQSISFYSKK